MLITGASSGLGRETALHLAEQGFQVIAGVRRQEDGERLANACPSGRISTLLIDVTDEESIGRAAARWRSRRYRALGPGEQRRDLHFRAAGMRLQRPAAAPAGSQPDRPARGDPGDPAAAAPWRRGAPGERHLGPRLGRHSLPGRLLRRAVRQGGSERRPAPRAGAHGHPGLGGQPGAIWTPIWGKIASEGERALADAPTPSPTSIAIPTCASSRPTRTARATARPSRRRRRRGACRAHRGKPRTRYRVGADVRRGTLLARLLPDSVIDGMFRPIVTAAPAAKEEQRA